ncbi:MBL fold metallo-hydrolase [bacterium]|nr:MBL fold metallo-hydrolase [bacterium]MBU1983851.1 MBL fold metallo-hydrolase [bacterium]
MVVWCDRTREAVIFDAPGDGEEILREIETLDLKPLYLVNTHGHMDHIEANGTIKTRLGIPLLIHDADRPMLTDPAKNLSLYIGKPVISPDADGALAEGDSLRVGNDSLKILHVPGHSPGSLVFHYEGFVIAGDTLFAGGIGRTDFPGGSEQVLLQNIRSKILSLPPETVVYPGHGPTTTVGEERRTNPFLRE